MLQVREQRGRIERFTSAREQKIEEAKQKMADQKRTPSSRASSRQQSFVSSFLQTTDGSPDSPRRPASSPAQRARVDDFTSPAKPDMLTVDRYSENSQTTDRSNATRSGTNEETHAGSRTSMQAVYTHKHTSAHTQLNSARARPSSAHPKSSGNTGSGDGHPTPLQSSSHVFAYAPSPASLEISRRPRPDDLRGSARVSFTLTSVHSSI